MNPDTLLYVKQKRRLTRRESQEATRERLIKAAEKSFIRHGFEASSVEGIADEAGFSRGAFYSNFRSKDELFIAVLQAKQQEIASGLEGVFRRESDPARRLRAVLDWYVKLDANRGWIILEAEFTLRACRSKAARTRMAEFNRQRFTEFSSLVATHFTETGATPAGRPEAIAVVLFAAAKGLDELTLLDSSTDNRELYAECRDLVFQQLLPAGVAKR